MEDSWEVLKFDSQYEISTVFNDEYKYPIRKIGRPKYITEFEDGGYIRTSISGKNQFKHRLIALQWIENDEPEAKTQIDHIDRNKFNNHLSNLRWVTPSENGKNKDKVVKQKYEYVNELPENTIQIRNIFDLELDRHYYDIDNEQLYLETKWTRKRYKIIKPHVVKNTLTVTLIDVDGNSKNRSYNKIINHLRDIL